MIIRAFPVMPRSDAPDPALRDLLDALDGGYLSVAGADAAAALGEHPDPAVTDLLRDHLRVATREVGPTEVTPAMHARLDPAALAVEEAAQHGLSHALTARRALVRRLAEALADRRSADAWTELAALAAGHPSAVVRAAVAGAMVGVRGDGGSESRAAAAPAEHLEGLVAAATNRDPDTWSIVLREYGAEAAMVIDPRRAYDRLAPFLVRGDPGDRDHEYSVRSVAQAWFTRMKPADDPRFTRALAELLDADAAIPISARQALLRGETTAGVDGALAALDRMIAGTGHVSPYLFEALGTCRDPRVLPALLQALAAPRVDPVVGAVLQALETVDDATALPAVEERLAGLAAGDKRAKRFRATVKHLGRNAPKAKAKGAKGKTAKEPAAPEPAAPGMPVWYAPPALSEPAADDPSLAALLDALPSPDAALALGARRDAGTTAAVRARLVEAADGICDFNWDQARVDVLAPALKGRVRKAYSAIADAVARRVLLVTALAVDLARRWDADGDAALIALLGGHRWGALASTLAPAVVAVEPSRAVLEALAARLDDPRLGAVDHPLLVAAATALFALGEDRALALAPSLLGVGERPASVAMVQAATTHLTARSDRRWLRLLLDDARGTSMPLNHFGAMSALADPGSADAIGEAMTPMLEHGIGLDWAVRALVSLGDRRGAEHLLRAMECPRMTGGFGEAVEALRKLGGPEHLARLRRLQESMRAAKRPWREPEVLDGLVAEWSA